MNKLFAIVPKVLINIGISLLSEKLIEELFWWGFEKLAKHTKTNIDNELLEMSKKYGKKS